MIVSGKKGLCPDFGMVVDIFSNSPGYTQAVVCGCAPAYFIKYHKAFLRGVVKYACGFTHLHHERGQPSRYIIRRPYPCKNPVNNPDGCLPGRDEAAYLRHDNNKGNLPYICGLACHIGPGKYYYLVICPVQKGIVGNKLLLHICLYHRMPAFNNICNIAVIYPGPCVIHLLSKLGKGSNDIHP